MGECLCNAPHQLRRHNAFNSRNFFVLDNAFNMQKLEKELEEALKKLDDEREQAEQQIRAQAETVADDIVAQILPESSKVKKGQKTAA